MKPNEFIARLDDERIVAEIESVEKTTSGEIRVFVAKNRPADALDAARVKFVKLGMTRTRQRNGVLIYFAPLTRSFAIWGDVGVHERCGEEFWKEITRQMTPHLQDDRPTDAIVEAVRKVGGVLLQHFPHEPDDRNELPDGVVRE